MKTTKGAHTQSTLDLKELIHELDKLTLQIVKEKSQQARTELALMAQDKINNFLNANSVPESTKKELKEIHKRLNPYAKAPITEAHKMQNAASRNNLKESKEGAVTEWSIEGKTIRTKFKKEISRYKLIDKKLLQYMTEKYCAEKGELTKEATLKERTMRLPLQDFLELLPVSLNEGDLSRRQIQDRKKNLMRDIRDALGRLFMTSVQITYTVIEKGKGKKRVTDYVDMFDSAVKRIEAKEESAPDDGKVWATSDPEDYGRLDISSGVVTFAFTPAFAEYVTKETALKTFHNVLYMIGTERRSVIPDVAWAVGVCMNEHWYIFENWKDETRWATARTRIDTHNKLTVKTLLKNSPLPTRAQAKKDPKKLITDPLIKAMEMLEDVGFLNEFKIFKDEEYIAPEVYQEFSYDELAGCTVLFDIKDPADISEKIKEHFTKKHQQGKKKRASAKKKENKSL